MSVGGILQNSLSQPSHELDMKLHRWAFISPGSRCLLMIIQVAGNLHAVTLLTIFSFVPSFTCSTSSVRDFSPPPTLISLIPYIKAVEVKFFSFPVCTMTTFPRSPPPQMGELLGSGWKVCVRVISSVIFNEGWPTLFQRCVPLLLAHAQTSGF